MVQDLRLAVRTIARAPSYAVMVVASLAVGIAAPTLAFSALNAAFLRPVEGVDQPEMLVAATLRNERGGSFSTYDDYVALRDGVADVASLAAQTYGSFAVVRSGSDAVALDGELVSANYFDTLRLRPSAGRFFAAGEARSMRDAVAVIGEAAWRRHFGSDPRLIGESVIVNGLPVQIVGVAPERFHGLAGPENNVELWVPFGLAELVFRRDGRPVAAGAAGPRNFTYIARLRPGATVALLQARGSAIVEGGANPRQRFVVGSLSRVGAANFVSVAAMVASIMALPLLVLAIACVNAGNLVLARAARSSAAWAVQLALGAGRARLLRQPLLEGLLLAMAAAAAGLTMTAWAFPALQATVPLDLVVDWRVTLFAVAIAAATPLAFGLLPAASVLSRAGARRPGETLKMSPRSRVRTGLIVAQAGLSLALLGTGAQFVRTVGTGFGDGFGPGDALLVASFDTDKARLTREDADAFYDDLLDRVQLVPGAAHAAIGGGLQFVAGVAREGQAALWLPEDSPARPRGTLIAYAAGDLFRPLRVSMIAGRSFLPEEHRAAPRAVIVNEPFVRRMLGGSALGRTIRLGTTPAHAEGVDVTVVGVVSGAENAPGRNDTLPTVYAPSPLGYLPVRTLYVPFRDAATLGAAMPRLREAVRSIDSRVPYTLETLDEARARRAAPSRFTALAVTVLGVVALLLAAAGVYAAVSYAVELRTREIGVRVALGATSSAVVRLVVGEAIATAALGALLGTAAAAATAIIVRSRLYGAATIDPAVFSGAIALLLASMLLASAIPALRATRVDPALSLRAE